jgi:hypothetical protein
MMRSERRNPAASARSSPDPNHRHETRGREGFLAALVRPGAREKRLANLGIRQAELVFHGEIGQTPAQGRREQTGAGRANSAHLVVDVDAVQPAAGRLRLQHVAGQIRSRQLVDPALRVLLHRAGMVDAGVDRDHARTSWCGYQPDGFARNAESQFHLRADADPLDVGIEGFEQGRVPLVAAVEPDLVAEQAGRDADPKPFHPRSASAMISTRAPEAARPTFTGVIATFAPNAVRHSPIAIVAASSSVT